MGSKLKPFNEKAICPKCGGDKIQTYHQGPIEDDPCWYDRKNKPVGKWPKHEYLHRTCDRCKYAWPEAIVSEPST